MENINAIDLGLPSGLLWADRNIGAESPEDSGLYFQWGDTQGYTKEQIVSDSDDAKLFYEFDYKFFVEGEDEFDCNMSKYNDTDGKNVLDLEDDAAHILIGGNWRMPTGEEFAELINNTNFYLITETGEEISGTINTETHYNTLVNFDWNKQSTESIKGMKLYNKDNKSNYIFIPSLYNEYGCMWSSSIKPTSAYKILFAYSFRYNKNDGTVYNNDIRYNTLPIRGVLDNN